MREDSTIYVAGSQTLLGKAISRQLHRHVGLIRDAEPDPTDGLEVEKFFQRHRPEYVFLAAGKSGGIRANQQFPADLMFNNLAITSRVIDAAHRHGTRKLLYLASSCCYPKHCEQPMRVESLMTGPLEPTNEAYAVAKIAGIKLCEAYAKQHGVRFISGIVADAFGHEEGMTPSDMHVVPALILRMHQAKQEELPAVEVWGTGAPRREFLFADDVADACVFVMRQYEGKQPINLGGGSDLSIREIAELIREVVGYAGVLRFDTSKPDGMPRKILDSSVLRDLGWVPKTPLREALARTYEEIVQDSKRGKELEPFHVR